MGREALDMWNVKHASQQEITVVLWLSLVLVHIIHSLDERCLVQHELAIRALLTPALYLPHLMHSDIHRFANYSNPVIPCADRDYTVLRTCHALYLIGAFLLIEREHVMIEREHLLIEREHLLIEREHLLSELVGTDALFLCQWMYFG